jgi:hypothetical protein
MPPEYAEQLLSYLTALGPRSVLAIGTEAQIVLDQYCKAHPRSACTQVGADADCGPARYDLCVISTTVENLDKPNARALIARMRDQHSRRLLVIAPIGVHRKNQASVWSRDDFLALGMRLIGRHSRADKPLHVYEFAIDDYKPTPEWLNSRHWAHPELFDKYWW